MRPRPQDLRVVKTIRSIRCAFEEMLLEMPYREVTVTALCERAMVNKKTFYRYYETLDSLLSEFQEDMVQEYLQRVEGLSLPEDLEAITRAFFSFAQDKGLVFERLTCARPFAWLRDEMTATVMERHAGGRAPQDPEDVLRQALVTEGTLAVYRRWVEDGKRLPHERLTELAVRLLCDGARR